MIRMTCKDIAANMLKMLEGKSGVELEHMLKCYNKIVAEKKEQVMYSIDSWTQAKMERRILIHEMAKMAEKNAVLP